MDPEAPKPEDRRQPASGKPESAQERLDALTAKKSADRTSGNEAESDGRPALTEKQRIEARRARRSKKSRRTSGGNPLAKGLKAAGFEIRRTAAFLGSGVIAGLAALGPVFSALGMGLVWLLERAGRGLKFSARLISRLLVALGRGIVVVDRAVTPQRALLLVAGLAAVLLAVSQFKGLGQIEIGQAGYTGIEDLARAPAIDKSTPAGAHTRIFIPIALVALAAVAVIVLGSVSATAARFSRFRRFASMVLVTIGLLSLIVTLLVDLPHATDTTEAALAYAGVKARLLAGFWLELAAGATLAVTGIALLLDPSAGPARRRERARRTERENRSARGSEGGTAMTAGRAINGGSA